MKTRLLIIGAGPYGISIASFAKTMGIEFIIVGEPMGFWKKNMPANMLLRSGIDWHLDPFGDLTFEKYMNEKEPSQSLKLPIPKNEFVGYAEWLICKKNLDIKEHLVSKLDYLDGKFVATLDNNQNIKSDFVVIAVGLQYFQNLPSFTKNLNKTNYSHTCDTVDFKFLSGKKCAIIGGRQSAFESASLLIAEGCAAVDIIYDHETPKFETSDWTWVDKLVENSISKPGWFNLLSEEEKTNIRAKFWNEGRLKLEPWLPSKLKNKNVTFWPNRIIDNVFESDKLIELHTDSGEELLTNHILLATGYKVNIGLIPFLVNSNLIENITIRNCFPVLDANFQSSFNGLFFTSLSSTQDFGPFYGFVKGAPATAQIIGNYLLGCT